MSRPWYLPSKMNEKPHAPVQKVDRGAVLPEAIARLAHAEYQAQGHSQGFERLHERGGFGWVEVVMLLADALEREREEKTYLVKASMEAREALSRLMEGFGTPDLLKERSTLLGLTAALAHASKPEPESRTGWWCGGDVGMCHQGTECIHWHCPPDCGVSRGGLSNLATSKECQGFKGIPSCGAVRPVCSRCDGDEQVLDVVGSDMMLPSCPVCCPK